MQSAYIQVTQVCVCMSILDAQSQCRKLFTGYTCPYDTVHCSLCVCVYNIHHMCVTCIRIIVASVTSGREREGDKVGDSETS